MSSNIQIISIEGNIGSGKSTLLENLRNHFGDSSNIIFLKEPVDEWASIKDENGVTMLEKFYENQEKYSFSFQMMAYISRLTNLKHAVEQIQNSDTKLTNNIIISERSLFTDKMVFAQMLYDSGNLEYIQFQIYLKWFDEFAKQYPISKIIYVKTSPERCHYRILKRSRTGENQIPIEYLDTCDKYHDIMVDTHSNQNICNGHLILDGNVDIYEDTEELKKWIKQIQIFIF